MANVPHIGSQAPSSWAKIAATLPDEGQATSEQQQSNQEQYPLITPSVISPESVRVNQNRALRDQLMEAALALEQEKMRADKYFEQIKHLESKISNTESQLANARKRLVSLQPPQDVSDEQVKRAFDDLCQNIEDWVDINCKELFELEQELSISGWTEQEMRLLENHMTEDDIKLCSSFPRLTAHIIMNAIFSFAYDCSLRDERWFVGSPGKYEGVLNKLVEAMSKKRTVSSTSTSSEHLAGSKFISNPQLRRWRSETFKGLQAGKDYTQQRKTGLDHAAIDLSIVLKHFARQPPGCIKEAVRNKILEAAEVLGDLIRTSNNGYRFNFVVNSSSMEYGISIREAQAYRLVNAETGMEEDMLEGMGGVAGRLRLCVFPALERVQDQGGRLQLSKALVVLEKASRPIEVQGEVDTNVAESVSRAGDEVTTNSEGQTTASTLNPKKSQDIEEGSPSCDRAISNGAQSVGMGRHAAGKWFNAVAESKQHAGVIW